MGYSSCTMPFLLAYEIAGASKRSCSASEEVELQSSGEFVNAAVL